MIDKEFLKRLIDWVEEAKSDRDGDERAKKARAVLYDDADDYETERIARLITEIKNEKKTEQIEEKTVAPQTEVKPVEPTPTTPTYPKMNNPNKKGWMRATKEEEPGRILAAMKAQSSGSPFFTRDTESKKAEEEFERRKKVLEQMQLKKEKSKV